MYPLLRLVGKPVWIALALAILAVAPALVLLARLATRVSGRPEPIALVRLLLVYVLGELSMLLAPASSHEERLSQLTRFLDELVVTALRTLRIRVEVLADPAAAEVLAGLDRPLLVFSRHAGPGDSVLLVHMLMARFGRAPGLVLKEILTVDPVVGIVSRHLPSALIDGAAEDPDEIRDVARGLGPDAALLLFPEGGNFTEARREKAITWLRRNGHSERAAHAERLRHMVSPRPRGVLAALDGAPGTDVVFTAHVGLGHGDAGLRLLRDLPRDTRVTIRLWHVPATEIPDGEAERVRWLDGWWERMHDWVSEQNVR